MTDSASPVSHPGHRKPEHRTGVGVAELEQAIRDKLFYHQAKFPEVATTNDWYLALASVVRDRLLHRWVNTAHTYFHEASRTVVYLSAEFLLGPQLGNNLVNLGIYDQVQEAVARLGLSLDVLLAQEEEPGLGNGGLGRLAACYMDSLATLEMPAIGYGIRYEFGIFDQEIRDGWQAEITDKWLRLGNPWEIPRPEIEYHVKLGGRTEHYQDEQGRHKVRWRPERMVKGIPHDTPILGYGVPTANMLRLWRAEACESFDFGAFDVGDYFRAVEEKVVSENISKVLYPNDVTAMGKQLRLEQQYFFVSCSLQDMVRIYRQREQTMDRLAEKYTVQLNDTHPAIAVAELMRILVDEHDLEWEPAWAITTKTFGYTNHTLLPEALETWPLPLFARLLPRHLEIIFEVNRRFLDQVRAAFPGDEGKLARLSLIGEYGDKQVRMANLATVGSHTVNGVAALHSQLLKSDLLRDFADLWPDKFTNITNGVTPRRFVALANPGLTRLISGAIGSSWIKDLDELRRLEPFSDDAAFRAEWRAVKQQNKEVLADVIQRTLGLTADPASLFDCQFKRLHEYKRQHLNVLHAIALYQRLKRNPQADVVPRTVLFGGKAAPGYVMAKLIIKLIHSVAEVVNNDPDVKGRLKIAFLPDFNVKSAQRVYPAADLSEQISTAGKEASGTGNMKFALNGALTIGTLDGANVEIRQAVGGDNFFLFGLTVEEAKRRKAEGYRPAEEARQHPALLAVLEAIGSGAFSRGDSGLFQPLLRSLWDRDDYMLFADFPSYLEAQERVSRTYADPEMWTRMAILNVARMGFFSSDRAIREYCEQIWKVKRVRVTLPADLAEHPLFQPPATS